MRYALILALMLSTTAFAQQSAPTVSLNLSDADIVQAFESLSKQANVSILGDSTASGKVTCSLSGLTVDQALDAVCKMNKLQWYKTYAGADEQLSADKLLKVVDALREIQGAPVICTDPEKKTRTVFIPDAGSVDTSALVTGLKLREVYVVRAIPAPKESSAVDTAKTKTTPSDKSTGEKSKAKSGDKGKTPNDALQHAMQGDARGAGNALWDTVKQMPANEQYQAISQLRKDYMKSLTPQQRKDLVKMLHQPKPKPRRK